MTITSAQNTNRLSLIRLAWILWSIGAFVFLVAIIWAFIYTGQQGSENDLAGLSLVVFPLLAGIAWVPLGITSLVMSIIYLANGGLHKAAGIGLIVATVLVPVSIALYFVIGTLTNA